MSTPISIRIDDQLNESLEIYITKKGMSKAEFIRSAIIDKLEDDYDLVMADESYEQWEAEGKKVKSFAEMFEQYG